MIQITGFKGGNIHSMSICKYRIYGIALIERMPVALYA